ncbi:MAG: cell division protein FtsQ [Elusimicrobia bacterium]|nr:cell division protein FtsQ [Elusimicrobiota bacterium]
MNKRPSSRRRYRVVARPQERARRAKLAGAAAAVALLGAVAVAALKNAAVTLAKVRVALPSVAAAGPEAAVVAGLDEPMLSLAQAAADSVPGTAGEKAAEIARRFPCVADVGVRRPWGEKRSTLTLTLKSGVAPALRRGRPAGVLGADGSVFAAPEGVYRFAGPSADVGDAPEADRRALAREWPALTAAGAMPAPLAQMAWLSAEDGWEARLQDGTTVAWGRLDWTKEKLSRLAEALKDARSKEPGAFTADLRWFEDGKVLLKPLGLKTAGVRGGLN